MISFCEERFPTDISYGISGGPNFNTEIVETAVGNEFRNMRTPYSRTKYNLASAIKTEEQLHKVISFFRAMRGRAIAFRFKDWLDYKAHQQFIAISDGRRKKYQLIKSYDIGTLSEVRKISKPVHGSVKVYVNNKRELKLSIDHKTGAILFYVPPTKGSIIRADFEFDVAARFDSDNISASIESYGVYSTHEISVIEVKV